MLNYASLTHFQYFFCFPFFSSIIPVKYHPGFFGIDDKVFTKTHRNQKISSPKNKRLKLFFKITIKITSKITSKSCLGRPQKLIQK